MQLLNDIVRWRYRIEEAERQSKEQEAQKLELQHDFDTKMDQLDTQCKVRLPFSVVRGYQALFDWPSFLISH